MQNFVKVGIPNGVFFISDIAGGEVPEFVRNANVLATPSCIGVVCLNASEGETRISIGSLRDVTPEHVLIFDNALETRNKTVAVTTVEKGKILVAPVPETMMQVRIWTNHPAEPDEVIIALGLVR